MHHARLIAATAVTLSAILATCPAAAQNKAAVPYKVISTTDYIQSKNPKPGERQRVDVLTQDSEGARHVNGHLSAIPPGKPGEKPQYHYGGALKSSSPAPRARVIWPAFSPRYRRANPDKNRNTTITGTANRSSRFWPAMRPK